MTWYKKKLFFWHSMYFTTLIKSQAYLKFWNYFWGQHWIAQRFHSQFINWHDSHLQAGLGLEDFYPRTSHTWEPLTNYVINSKFKLVLYFFQLFLEPGSAPRNVRVRPLSSTTMVIQWDEPSAENGLVTVILLNLFLLNLSKNLFLIWFLMMRNWKKSNKKNIFHK